MRVTPVTIALGVALVVTLLSVSIVNNVVPSPYMDERFHIPQAQRYCALDFTWDDKITTLPGLYIVSLATLEPLSYFLHADTVCATSSLRFVNSIFAVGIAVVAQSIARLVNRREGGFVALTMLAVVFFPLNYFSGLLYYTDPGSTFFVLLCYLLGLRRQHISSAAVGAVAVLFRQSNILWVFFTAACCVVAYLQPRVTLDIARRYPLSGRAHAQNGSVARQHPTKLAKQNFIQFHSFLRVLAKNSLEILRVFWMYAAVGMMFVFFVFTNKGIVVGDKENHQASLHVSQLLYYFLFTAVLSGPSLLQAILNHASTESKPMLSLGNFGLFFLLSTICAIVLYNSIIEHEFLLADNRHFTFYIWKRIIGHNVWRYVLSPLYAIAMICLWASLRPQGVLFRILFFAVVAMSVIPQRLLEFRYFIVPYIMFRLHMQPGPSTMRVGDRFLFIGPVMLEIGVAIAINSISLFAFLFMPFTWDDSEDVQRFMW
eukprot:CFRG5144T1